MQTQYNKCMLYSGSHNIVCNYHSYINLETGASYNQGSVTVISCSRNLRCHYLSQLPPTDVAP